ncbi:MAG: alanine--tRNA ligase, partial [Pseudomonadota bacterium]
RLVPALVREMGEQYPELKRAEPLIGETLRLEEERFKQTLERGLKLLEDETAKISDGGTLPGDSAFKLYDTYGFPLDLTQDILRAKNLEVDISGFETCMAKQRADARAAWSGSGDKATSKIWFEIKERVGASEFLGYSQDIAAANLLAIVVDGKEVEQVSSGTASLIFNQTPFYGESGGQVGDIGAVSLFGNVVAQVNDTRKPVDSLHVHIAEISGLLKVGDQVDLRIDSHNRNAIRANHTATHILHAVLQREIGDHITQKGSLVDSSRLRFDVSHNKAFEKSEIHRIEQEVNKIIRSNQPVITRIMTPEDAIKQGAMALFGEKYGDEVRVVSVGETYNYSTELCGGTHVKNSGEIAIFKIISEAAVAAGIRRIEAVTGEAAYVDYSFKDMLTKDLALQFKAQPSEIFDKISALAEENKELKNRLGEAEKRLAIAGSKASEETLGAIKFTSNILDIDPKELRPLAEEYLKTSQVAFVASNKDGKASLVIGVAKDLTGKINAVELLKPAVEIVGGKGGGGRPEMAQGGGSDAANIGNAIEAVKKIIAGLS